MVPAIRAAVGQRAGSSSEAKLHGGRPVSARSQDCGNGRGTRATTPRLLLLPVPNRCIDVHQPQRQQERSRHQAGVFNPFTKLAE